MTVMSVTWTSIRWAMCVYAYQALWPTLLFLCFNCMEGSMAFVAAVSVSQEEEKACLLIIDVFRVLWRFIKSRLMDFPLWTVASNGFHSVSQRIIGEKRQGGLWGSWNKCVGVKSSEAKKINYPNWLISCMSKSWLERKKEMAKANNWSIHLFGDPKIGS